MSRRPTLLERLQAASLATLLAGPASAEVVINEIYYEPSDGDGRTEFVELYNAGTAPADLSGWYLSDGIFYAFAPGTSLGAGAYLVVAEEPEALRAQYGVTALGPYAGRLSNEGDRVALRDAAGNPHDVVEYGIGFPWPTASSGEGASIELIDPGLDNAMGGSWRASLAAPNPRALPDAPVYLIRARANFWHYWKGLEEPSGPPEAWRAPDFAESDRWASGSTSIGFGQDDDLTPLDDMAGRYTSVYLRRSFTVDDPDRIPALRLRTYVADGCVVWLNGSEVARLHVRPGEFRYSDVTGEKPHPAEWEEVTLPGPPRQYLVAGTNVVAVHALSAKTSGHGFSFDLELSVPAAPGRRPTPGARNTVSATLAPPQIRDVVHSPKTPRGGEPIVFTAKVSDPQGVGRVTLHYQANLPGQFVPARLPVAIPELIAHPETPPPENAAFANPANWTSVQMLDDGRGDDAEAGDGIYTAAVPGFPNRTLVRYRIEATDRATNPSTVRVPYADDPSRNFALFVHDGVPPFRPLGQTVHPAGLGHEYSSEVMTSVPAYHLIVREADFLQAHAYQVDEKLPQWAVWPIEYHPAFDVFNWECALVYEGQVYDHVRFRLRQANSRYLGAAKRSLRFRFNPGHRFQARDAEGTLYPAPWRSLNLGKMFNNAGEGDFGLVESMNSQLWNLVGVSAPRTHHVTLRVVDAPEEAPATPQGQFAGDFWGLYLAMEDLDATFLESHQMPDGNLYKLKAYVLDGTQLERHSAQSAPAGDGDFQNAWRNLLRPQTDEWIRQTVNLDHWYRYFAVAEAVRHTDFATVPSHMKNQAWYFGPLATSRFGQLWFLPWDSDMSWGPTWSEWAIDHARYAVFGTNGIGHPNLKREYRNTLREFRDLVWQRPVIETLLDRLVGRIGELSRADRDRWKGALHGQDFGPLEDKQQDMLAFAFEGWDRPNGLPVPPGGRAAVLDALAGQEGDSIHIPLTPEVTYRGPDGYPADQLAFAVTRFRDPQSDDTFAAIRWRIAEVTDPAAPAYDPAAPPLIEWPAVWDSGEQSTSPEPVTLLPGTSLRPGHAYRVRAKYLDQDGHWSHWSAPAQFVAEAPLGPSTAARALRVVEIMYHAPGDDVFDYLEVANLGADTIDLADIELRGGVQFRFREGTVRALGPGERVVVVEDLACFRQRYPAPTIRVAGEYSGALSNKGERIELIEPWKGVIQTCAYEDSWYPASDGGGYSLVLVNPASLATESITRSAWRVSDRWQGSPGSPSRSLDADRDGLPDEWELARGLSPSSAADASSDADGDGLSALEEFIAGTDPDDAQSRLTLAMTRYGSSFRMSFPTVLAEPAAYYTGQRFYLIEQRHGLEGTWESPFPSIEATGGAAEITVHAEPAGSPMLYRLRVWISPN